MISGEAVELQKTLMEGALAHLDAICQSTAFESSKRCQEFLRFIVLETLHGHADQIKERNIAREVFGKGDEFEPGDSSIVRVKAGEVRKRLSDFYEGAAPQTIRIELPLGSYVPRIYSGPGHLAAPSSLESKVISRKALSRRGFFWIAAGAAGVAGIASLVPLLHHKQSSLDLLWRPIFETKAPLLIFIPVMRDGTGTLTEWVGIGPAVTLSLASDFLSKHHYPFHLRFGQELTFSQLREQPNLLLGGFGMDWTMRMMHDMRIVPIENVDGFPRAFIDSVTKKVWGIRRTDTYPYTDMDYGILCRLFDQASGQIVMLAVGGQTFGTEGAASLLFDPILFENALRQAPANWEGKNFQVVIRVSVLGTTPSSPEFITSHFW